MPYTETITRVTEALEEVFGGLDAWFDRPLDVRMRSPADGGWTIDEVLEHVTIVNHFLLLTIRKGCAKAIRRSLSHPVTGEESDLGSLSPLADPDAFDWQAPEHMMPSGTAQSDAVRDLLRSQKEECLALIAGMGSGEGTLCAVRMSVRDLGKIDMYQWLYFLAMHARRHLTQIGRRAASFSSCEDSP